VQNSSLEMSKMIESSSAHPSPGWTGNATVDSIRVDERLATRNR
jgi:hypothetical protein